MRKLLLFTAALLCAASMWAQDPVVEGPWTQLAKKSHTSTKDVCLSMEFVNMDDDQWSGTTITPIQDGDGVSFIITGKSDTQHKMGIFSTYKKEVELPAYSCLTLTWKYQLRSKSTKHHSSTCLYALQGTEDDINSLEVDFSNHHDSNTGADNLLDCYVNKAQDGETKKAGEKTATFVFDNYGGTDQQTKAWYLLLTHVIASGDGKSGLKEWGSFLSKEVTTTWTYRSIISFDANDGTGDMEVQTIDGTGKLQANEFTRADYVFAGWATEPNGDVVYPDGAVITVTEGIKGPQTLYAKWTEWGQGKKEGPWTFLEMKTDSCNRNQKPSTTFNALNGKQWPGTIYNVGDDLGAGYTYGTVSPAESKLGIFSTYMYEAIVPSYTSMTLNWKYKVSSKSTGHYSSVCLYIVQDTYDSITNRLTVDYSNQYKSTAGAENLLTSPFINKEQNGKQRYTSTETAAFTFDNSEGTGQMKDTCFMMMTYVMESGGGKTGLDENGFFKSISADTTWTYYKFITFNKNADDAGGMMTDLDIENSGNLLPCSFRRNGYTFQGWATSADGEVVYADKAEITATANDKGLVTLYAKWAEGGGATAQTEGPWTLKETKTGTSAKSENDSISFNNLNGLKWTGDTTQWQNYGIGYSFVGTSPADSKMGIFSAYEATATVPSYTNMVLEWSFNLYIKSTKHYATVCLYGGEGSYVNGLNIQVPFTNRYDEVKPAVTPPLMAWFYNDNSKDAETAGKVSEASRIASISFDNRLNSEQQTKKSYMIMAYMLGSSDSQKEGLNEAGSFQSVRIDTTWIYCKTITFDPNGGTGEMATQYINNSGRLYDNNFTRAGHTFQGWATESDGQVIYSDGAEITATANDKGPVTLFAKWAEGGGATAQTEGPWTLKETKTGTSAKSENDSISFNNLNGLKWTGDTTQWQNYGIGYSFVGTSPADSKMGIFSAYEATATVPSYTNMVLEWSFNLYIKSTKHYATVCLYGGEGSYVNGLNIQVPFTNRYDEVKPAVTPPLMAWFYNDNSKDAETAGKVSEASRIASISFDNRLNSEQQTKKSYMIMAYMLGSSDSQKEGLNEAGSFQSVRIDTTWIYCKTITFDPNGGTGEMATQYINNSGRLYDNNFTRAGHTFQGWATESDGQVIYSDGAEITATANDKGPVTLFAKWAEGGGATVQTEGPWTQNAVKTHVCANDGSTTSMTFNTMNSNSWGGTITSWRDQEGLGYTYRGSSENTSLMGIFSTYRKQVAMPAYSSMKLTWTFWEKSKSTKHHSATCLYASDSYDALTNLEVDFSNHHDSETGAKYLLAPAFVNKEQAGRALGIYLRTCVLDFDNSLGSTEETKSWYLMMTHVMGSAGAKDDLYEWGAFKSVSVQEVWSYYKLITLHANGGAGQMTGPVIENAGNLPANTFVRGGYTFAGWAKTPNGEVVYADKAAVTATLEDKGLLDLYAVWTPNQYAINYELNGGAADNPASYAENAALTLNPPTKAGYTFLGWTGSNGDIPQTGVAIAKGSKGNKSFTANWISNAVAYTIDLIDLIGVVENTPESKAKIDDARDAYDALNEEEQAFVSNYAMLLAAEAAYAAFDPSIIKFMEQDGETQIGDDRLIAIYYPEAPVIAGFTFKLWQTIAEDVTAGTIRLQAVYTQDEPTGIEDVDAKANAEKFIKNGNLYILKDEFIYTINGQKVK